MTQSNFKYSTGQAGSTLFEPKKESKPFDPFDIQAASQPILNALARNKEIEVENLGRTGDYGLESMRIEQSHDLVVQEHNNRVAKLNDEYDLEQFAKFSKAAQEMFTMAAQHKAEQSKKWSYTKLLSMPADDRAKLLTNHQKLVDSNNKFVDNAASQAILDTLSTDSSRVIAEDLLRATGWRRKAFYEATKAERLNLIPQKVIAMHGVTRGKVGDNGPEEGTEERRIWEANNPTINEIKERLNNPKSNPMDSEEIAYANELSGKILSEITEHEFIPNYDAKEIYTSIQPILDTFHGDTVQDITNKNEQIFQENLIASKHKELLTTLQNGAVNPNYNAAQETVTKNYDVWSKFDENGMSGALQKSLKSVLELSAADKIGHIQATQFVDELIQIPGQCHVKKDGECFTTLRQWRPNDLAAVDFDNELLKISMKDEKVAKADYDGMIKVAKDALQEQYINSGNRPISTEALEGLVDMVHQRAGGRRSDIAKALMESVDTVQGLTDEEGLKQLAQDSAFGKRPRNPKDYQHISHAAMVKAYKAGYLTVGDTHVSTNTLNSFATEIKPLGINLIAGEGGTEIQAGLEGINFIDNAKLIYEANYYAELKANPTADKATNLANARTKTLQFISDEKNLDILKGPRLVNNDMAAIRKKHAVELRDAGTNQVALSGLQYRIKEVVPLVQKMRAAGDTRSLSKLIPTTYTKENGTAGVFFDETWRSAARAAQQSPEKFLQTQLKLAGYDTEKNIYTPPEGDLKIQEGGGPDAQKRVDTNNTHLSLEDQLKELKANKPKPDQAGDEFMGQKVKPAKYRTPDGQVITPERDPDGLMAWEEKVKALEEKIKLQKEESDKLIGEPIGPNKQKLSEIFGYPISQSNEFLKRLGFKNRDIITEVELAHISRRADLLYNPDTPFPEYTLYGGIG